MVCTECGARLSEVDQFCPKCGAKVIKKRRCPDCGALLKEDNRFCPKCGRLVGEKKTKKTVPQDTMDIPMESIERNILSETAAEIRTDKRPKREVEGSVPKRPSSSKSASSRRPSDKSYTGRDGETRSKGSEARNKSSEGRSRSGEVKSKSSGERQRPDQDVPVRKKKAEPPVQRRKPQPAPPPKKKRPVYREEIVEDDDWEEDDWEDDDWDDDDDEGVDILTVMTAIMGCVVLVIVAFLAFNLYRQYVPKNYEKAAESQEESESEEESDEEQGESQEQEVEQPDEQQSEESAAGTLTISADVRIRDNPSTSDGAIIKTAHAGETYEYLEAVEGGTWYKIVLSEDGYSEGYVFAEYVTVD